MEYFTGKFQGRIPVTSQEHAQAATIQDPVAAHWIATLLTAIFGGREWEALPQPLEQVFIICR